LLNKWDRPSKKGDLPSQIEIREIAHPRSEISLLGDISLIGEGRSPFVNERYPFIIEPYLV
jgi:hypothetical protein